MNSSGFYNYFKSSSAGAPINYDGTIAIGGNATSAALMGISVRHTTIRIYLQGQLRLEAKDFYMDKVDDFWFLGYIIWPSQQIDKRNQLALDSTAKIALLEKVETAYGGRFKLAKLNSDDQPEIAGQLSQAFGVRSIPFCVLFKDGQPVDGFVGAIPEAQIREFLDRHVPSAEALEAEEDTAEADLVAGLQVLAHAAGVHT